MSKLPETVEYDDAFKAELERRVEVKLQEEGRHYREEATRWAAALIQCGLAENLGRATPENAARRDALTEMMVEAYYDVEVRGSDLIPLAGRPSEVDPAIPGFYTGNDRQKLIREVEAGGTGGTRAYRDGVDFFVINAVDNEFRPIEDRFEARALGRRQ